MCARMRNFLLFPLLGTIARFSHGVPLKPGQPGGPWTEHEVEVTIEKVGPHQFIISSNIFPENLVTFGTILSVNTKLFSPIPKHLSQQSLQVRAMLDCDQDCWLSHPVAKLLAEGELDDYSRPHEEDTSGPRC